MVAWRPCTGLAFPSPLSRSLCFRHVRSSRELSIGTVTVASITVIADADPAPVQKKPHNSKRSSGQYSAATGIFWLFPANKAVQATFQLPDWLARTVDSQLATPPFSVIRPRHEALAGLPLEFQQLLHSAFQLTSSADAAVVLLRIAEDPSVNAVQSGRCGLQAGLALIDAGQAQRGWSVIQRAIARLSAVPTKETSTAVFRTTEWLGIAAGAIAVGDTDAAETWLQRAIKSLKARVMDSVVNSTAGYAAASLESLQQLGDVYAVRASVQILTMDYQEAVVSLKEAMMYHQYAEDTESVMSDQLLMAAIHSAMGNTQASHDACRDVRRQLALQEGVSMTARTSILWNLIAAPVLQPAASHKTVTTMAQWN